MSWKFLLLTCMTALLIFSLWFYRKYPLHATVTINDTKFFVELSVTAPEKSRGLSFRKSLIPRHGMLFVYDYKDTFSFWMQGMQFPLDFIWIADNLVVDITKNVPPATALNMHVVRSSVPVNKILEINAGEIEKYGIKIGDTVTFNK